MTLFQGQPVKSRKSGSVIEQIDDALNLFRRGQQFYQNHMRWNVTVSSDDRLYDVAMRWFLSDEADTKPPRNLKARYVHGPNAGGKATYIEDFDGSIRRATEPGVVELVYNETRERSVTIKGHKVTISLQKPDGHNEDGTMSMSSRNEPDKLHFYARTREGQSAVTEHLRELAHEKDKRKPALHLLSSWGDWSRRDDLPQRKLDSVVLRTGQMERLRDDIQGFIDDEDEYNRRGMPYHRGYMLYGPPGTGKTSIVRALAAHFGLDLWYAPLGDLEKDTSLMSLVNQVKPGSILLLEDVDVYHATRERDDAARGTSMAGLLNALDGVATPHGLITFMTTNEIDVIDKALLRPGRIDIQEEIGYPDQDQIARLFEFWYDTTVSPSDVHTIEWTGTTAALTNLFKSNNMDDAFDLLHKQSPEAEQTAVGVSTAEE